MVINHLRFPKQIPNKWLAIENLIPVSKPSDTEIGSGVKRERKNSSLVFLHAPGAAGEGGSRFILGKDH